MLTTVTVSYLGELKNSACGDGRNQFLIGLVSQIIKIEKRKKCSNGGEKWVEQNRQIKCEQLRWSQNLRWQSIWTLPARTKLNILASNFNNTRFLFFFRDKTEPLKQLTPEESREMKNKERLRTGGSGTYSTYSPRRERGLKIDV